MIYDKKDLVFDDGKPLVTLTKEEVEFCWDIAKQRQAMAEKRNLTNLNVSDMDDTRTNYVGVACELVCKKHFNIDCDIACYDLDILLNKEKLGLDCKYFEVRSLPSFGRQLLIRERDVLAPYVAVKRLNDTTYKIMGWRHSEDIKVKERWQTPRQHTLPCYQMDVNELHPIKTLSF